MRKKYFLIVVVCLLAAMLLAGQGMAQAKKKAKKNSSVKISEKKIWRQVASYDKNKDRKLSRKERKRVKKIEIRVKSGDSRKLNLKELKYFPKLETLSVVCDKKNMKLKGMASLKQLQNLETLTLLGCNLPKLDISNIQSIHDLTVSSEMGIKVKKLKLYGRGNSLRYLTIHYVKGPKTLDLYDFNLSSARRLEIRPYLRKGETVTGVNPDLETVFAGQLHNLREFVLGAGNVSNLQLYGGSYLNRVHCADNQLKKMDLGYCANLDELHCENNRLTSIDVSQYSLLSYLYCQGNPLTELKVFDGVEYFPYYPPRLKYVAVDNKDLLEGAVKEKHTLLDKGNSLYEILYQNRDGDKDAYNGSQGWDRTREYTLQTGDTIYYAYLSRDGKRSWIRRIDHLDHLSPVKIVLPKTINGAPVTRLGMDVQLGFTAMKEDLFDAEMNLFDDIFEPWHDEEGNWRTDVNVRELVLPKTVTEIEAGAFGCLQSLKKINIPPQVTELSDYLFYNCKSLKKLNIPSSVKNISKNAFSGAEHTKLIGYE